MNKAKEILDKHLLKNGWTKEIKKESNLYNTILGAMEEAINYSQCCKSDSELLQKIEMVKSFKWGIDSRDNERRICELIQLL